MCDCKGLVVANFEGDDGIACQEAVTSEEGGDGAVKGETVLDWRVGVVSDECTGVLIVFDG